MKNRSIIFSFLLFTITLYSQKMPEDYLDEGDELFNKGEYNAASENYLFIIKNYSSYKEIYPFALYNLAISYEKQNKNSDAIAVYTDIISKSFDKDLQKGTNG